MDSSLAHLLILLVFVVGYLAIVFEYKIKVNKTASALLMAVLTWLFLFSVRGHALVDNMHALADRLSEVSQVIFFLLGAMTLVELVDSHRGFLVITDFIQTGSKKRLLWLMGAIGFLLSSVLDNLTTTIVMLSLVRKLVKEKEERFLLGSAIVIAANAGGAWTPIGDITTTMLWIQGNITTLRVIQALLFPSLVTLVVALGLLSRQLQGRHPQLVEKSQREKKEPGSLLVFVAGLGSLIFVPVFKAVTGMPPFMGMLIALSVLWLITDILHKDDETRHHLKVPHVLTKIDTSGVLFFLGILLCISALDVAGLLRDLAHLLDQRIGNFAVIATFIGLISAVIDNVPLVAAAMRMYSLDQFPTDSFLWMMIAFCAGTGGSILIVGSAAGVALMGIEKVDFLWYLKKISWVALLSYFAGIGAYLVQDLIV
jgi:NhaD family Na+/H+ antiporter